ncbi:hypothetical protein AVW13_13180 [Brevibacterium casei]|uniref:Uncharacterized protein n=1 Tax=Brevibacterium casei TaxID=33889 RepID=A0AB34XQY6_9MICO|nr:hypothetical protein AVW13_13180 [Brevibacterium casei]
MGETKNALMEILSQVSVVCRSGGQSTATGCADGAMLYLPGGVVGWLFTCRPSADPPGSWHY